MGRLLMLHATLVCEEPEMRFHHLDLNLLVILDALLVEQNITRAGERLHLSQSATSGALARLREFYEDDLLVQVGRKMVRTPLGESLAKPVRDILIQVQAAVEHRPVFDPAASRRKFVLMMSDYTSTVLMPEVGRATCRVAPDISFEFLTPTNSPGDDLDRGSVDFLILPDASLSGDHPSQALFEEDFVCIAWTGNRLIDDCLSMEQYKTMGHVQVRFGTQRVPSVDEWLLRRYDFQRRVEVIVATFNAMPQFLVGTDRIATMHRRLANLWVNYLPLKIVQPPMELPSIRWVMQWHKYRDIDPGTVWLRNQIIQVARGLDAH